MLSPKHVTPRGHRAAGFAFIETRLRSQRPPTPAAAINGTAATAAATAASFEIIIHILLRRDQTHLQVC